MCRFIPGNRSFTIVIFTLQVNISKYSKWLYIWRVFGPYNYQTNNRKSAHFVWQVFSLKQIWTQNRFIWWRGIHSIHTCAVSIETLKIRTYSITKNTTQLAKWFAVKLQSSPQKAPLNVTARKYCRTLCKLYQGPICPALGKIMKAHKFRLPDSQLVMQHDPNCKNVKL